MVYHGDILTSSFADLLQHGSEAGIYVSDNATEEQREVLDSLVADSIGGMLVGKNFGIKYVPIDIEATESELHVKTPFGEMQQHLMTGHNGGPIRIENSALPYLSDLKYCNTDHWSYKDHGKDFDYKDRCGTWADFAFSG